MKRYVHSVVWVEISDHQNVHLYRSAQEAMFVNDSRAFYRPLPFGGEETEGRDSAWVSR